ncbi:hypothetical protein V1503_24420 [Bacillus sp. SCS-151]|uniref:hypothetical protein n=1 Tax=Nanhaiella sioensis TaxID=3115293 RepID=UPI00397C6D99
MSFAKAKTNNPDKSRKESVPGWERVSPVPSRPQRQIISDRQAKRRSYIEKLNQEVEKELQTINN